MERFGSAYRNAIGTVAAEHRHNFGKGVTLPLQIYQPRNLRKLPAGHIIFLFIRNWWWESSYCYYHQKCINPCWPWREACDHYQYWRWCKRVSGNSFQWIPKLQHGGGVEFLKSMQSTRILETIPFTISSSPRLLRSYIGAARVYIRPMQVNLDLNPAQEVADQVRKWHVLNVQNTASYIWYLGCYY